MFIVSNDFSGLTKPTQHARLFVPKATFYKISAKVSNKSEPPRALSLYSAQRKGEVVVKLVPLDRKQALEVALSKNLAVLLVPVFLPPSKLTLLAAVPKETALDTLHQLRRFVVASVAGSHPLGKGSVSLNFVAELHHVVEGDRKDLKKN